MPIQTIGDLRQHFFNVHSTSRIKTELNTLVQELSTGEKADLPTYLGAGQTALTSVDRQLDLLDQFARSNMETAQMLSTMQIALGAAETQRAKASDAMVRIDLTSPESEITAASRTSEQAFNATVEALNTRYADKAVFGGIDLTTPPLAPANDIMDALRIVVTGATSADDVSLLIDDWFDTPGGGFETVAVLSEGSGVMTRPTDQGQEIEIEVAADDQAVRDLLKAYAKGALSTDNAVPLAEGEAQKLLRSAGVELLSASVSLTDMQAQLGYAEGEVAETAARIAAQEATYGMARNDLVSADPFETAARLESVQSQLETHYLVTARLSRLSLTEYLR